MRRDAAPTPEGPYKSTAPASPTVQTAGRQEVDKGLKSSVKEVYNGKIMPGP